MIGVLEAYHDRGVRDPRALDALAAELLASLPPASLPDGATAAEHARALVHRADFEPGDEGSDALQWVVDALKLWPDCAEAYMFAARIIEGREHAIILMQPFYTLALEALHRRLAPAGVANADGTVRTIPEAPMYLRGLCGLGEALATQARFPEAQASFVEALRLDPADGENVRPRLALVELLLGQKIGARDRLKDARPGLITGYVTAFVTLAIQGDGPAARQALAAARGANPHLFPMLTLAKKMPGVLTDDPVYDEAQYACLALAPAFLGRTGLREWLKHVGASGHAPPRRVTSAKKKKRR